jgi:hypothetical protein
MEIICSKCNSLGILACDIIICSNEKCKHEWYYDGQEDESNEK